MNQARARLTCLCSVIAVFLLFVIQTSARAEWFVQEINAPRSFSSYANSQRAIILDRVTGKPRIAYGGDHLYHAYQNGTQWSVETVDGSSGVGKYASMAQDGNGYLHFSYYDTRNSSLKYATNMYGSWLNFTLDTSAGNPSCIAIDSSNKVHIGYYDNANGGLKYATNASGNWTTTTVDTSGDTGWYPSLAVDRNNKIHVAYFSVTAMKPMYATNATGTWVSETVDPGSGNNGQPTSLVVDANGKAHITYGTWDAVTGQLRYATNASGSWLVTVIDGTTVGDKVGANSVLVMDTSGNLHVCYSDEKNWNTKYAIKNQGTWSISTFSMQINNQRTMVIDSAGKAHVSAISGYSLYYMTNMSGSWVSSPIDTGPGPAGTENAITVDRTNTVHVAFINPGQHLYYATYVSGSWEQSMLDPTHMAASSAITTDNLNKVHIAYSSYETGSYALKFATDATGSWIYTVIDNPSVHTWAKSIATDSNNRTHISYYTQGTSYALKYATNASGSWQTATLDSSAQYIGSKSAIAVDTGNHAHIAYYDGSNKDLKYATNLSGSWVTSTIDATAGSAISGEYLAIATDAAGKVHIAYSYSSSGNVYNNNLAYITNASGSWVKTIIDTAAETGFFPSIAVDANSKIHIVYADSVSGYIKYATNAKSPTYIIPPAWSIEPVVISTTNVSNSMAIDSNGKLHISFHDWASSALKYVTNKAIDVTPPTGTITINNSAVFSTSATVTLTLTCNDLQSACSHMQFSNDNATWSTAETYAASKSWLLSTGDGSKNVYVKFRDTAGNWSDPSSDSILLDTTAPVSSTSPGSGSQVNAFTVTLSCSDGSGSGCASTYYTTDGSTPTLSSSRYTGTPITVSGLTSPVYFKFFSVDSLGNTEGYKTATYSFVSGYTTLTMDLASPTLLQNGLLDLSGKLTRYPDSEAVPNNSMDLYGLPVTVKVTGPPGSPCATGCTESTATYTSLGHYRIQNIDRFSYKGPYTIQAHFAGTGLHQPSDSAVESLLVGASAGYAILIEGKVNTSEGLDSHNKTVGRIYETLKERGFVDDNIIYLNYAGTMVPGVDGIPKKAGTSSSDPGVQWAIETWAAERMNGAPAPLYLVFVDHGNQDTLYIDPATIAPGELNGWLASLEAGLNAAARLEKRVLILGACYSGSFIETLKQAPLPGVNAGRIVITSAAADEQSYKGPNEPDNVRSGEFFIEELFKQLKKGASFKAAFREAGTLTRTFTSQGSNVAGQANGYGDSSVQHPLLEDDGVGSGSNTLADGIGDGMESELLHLGFGVTNASLGPADIKAFSATHFLNSSATGTPTPLWLEPFSNAAVSSAWFEVKAPTTLLSGTGGSGQLALDIPKVPMVLMPSGRWEPEPADYPVYTTAGKYEVYYFTKSTNTELSEMRRSLVYKDRPGNAPPTSFDLVAPSDSGLPLYPTKVRTTFNMVWTPSTDSDGLTYTVQVATDNGFTAIVYQKEEITSTWHYVDEAAALADKTVYHWRVLAVDSYGESTPCSQEFRSFETDNTNALPGYIKGYVYDNGSAAVVGATVTAALAGTGTVAQAQTVAGGAFVMVVQPGTYAVNAAMAGYAGGGSGSFGVASAGTANTTVYITVSNPTLRVTLEGSGYGTVTSAPAGISCISGSPANCSAPYPNGTPVTMTASPDWKSLFGGWSGAYTGSTNPLDLAMSYHRSLTAAFTPNLQARVGATGYASLQEAYDNLATVDGSTIMAREYTFLEPGLLFNSSKTVTINGGWDSDYNLRTGMTTIDGTLTVRQGRLNVRNLVVK